MSDTRSALQNCVDAIESGYEFCLAYAAQGRRTDLDGDAKTSELRTRLQAMAEAAENLSEVVHAQALAAGVSIDSSMKAFFDALGLDADRAAGILRLTLSRNAISSQLIDNVNASIHIRALLTDLFIVDEALR